MPRRNTIAWWLMRTAPGPGDLHHPPDPPEEEPDDHDPDLANECEQCGAMPGQYCADDCACEVKTPEPLLDPWDCACEGMYHTPAVFAGKPGIYCLHCKQLLEPEEGP